MRANRLGQSKRNIEAHYDLSNELYALFLDDTMTYSAAYFPDPTVTLEEAQEAKYARLAEKVARRRRLPRARDRLRVGRVRVVRRPDLRLPRHRHHRCPRSRPPTPATGWSARASTTSSTSASIDYREVRGQFDRIVSIEMLEAVGHRYLGTYFETVDRLLAPDGLAAIQVITIPEQRYDNYRRRPDFIQRYIFPGGHLPSLEAMSGSMGDHGELYVEHVENIGVALRRDARVAGASGSSATSTRSARSGFDDAVRADVGVLPRLLRGGLPGALHQRPPAGADAADERHARRRSLRPQLVPVREADLPPRRLRGLPSREDVGREAIA